MGSAVHIAVTAIYSISCLLITVAVFLPYWKQNDPSDTLNDSIIRHEGLWIQCQTFTTGKWECDDFNKFFLGLDTSLQVARAFSISSLALSLAGIALIAVAMCDGSKSTQKKMTLSSGGAAILAGLLIIVAVSWYANDIRIDYENKIRLTIATGSRTTKQIFGASLFLGWVGGSLQVVGSLIAICISCGRTEEQDIPPTYRYQPSKASVIAPQEYV